MGAYRLPPNENYCIYAATITYFLTAVTTLLKAYSHAYILITLIPVIISFMTRTRLSVILADFNLYDRNMPAQIPSKYRGMHKVYTCIGISTILVYTYLACANNLDSVNVTGNWRMIVVSSTNTDHPISR